MQMNKPVICHRDDRPVAAVFKTVSFYSRSGLKQSAERSAQNLQITPRFYCDIVFSLLVASGGARAAINPTDCAANQGKYFILFRSLREYYVCRGAENVGEMEDGKTTNGTSQLRGLMVLRLPSSPALTKVHNALLCSFDYSDEGSPRPPLSLFHFPAPS